MVDRDGLENRCTFTGTVGSNPTLSAITSRDNSLPDNSGPLKSPGNAGFSRQSS